MLGRIVGVVAVTIARKPEDSRRDTGAKETCIFILSERKDMVFGYSLKPLQIKQRSQRDIIRHLAILNRRKPNFNIQSPSILPQGSH